MPVSSDDEIINSTLQDSHVGTAFHKGLISTNSDLETVLLF